METPWLFTIMALTGPVSTTIPPTDRLSLLPKELLDKIYSLVLQSDTSPWTLYIKTILQPSKHAGYSRPDPDPIPSILALPQDCKNKALRRESPNAKWPDSVEEAFLRGMPNTCHDLSS